MRKPFLHQALFTEVTKLIINFLLLIRFHFYHLPTVLDVRPENVGFTSDGTLKLFDFEHAVCIKRGSFCTESQSTYNYKDPGTFPYIAPERSFSVARLTVQTISSVSSNDSLAVDRAPCNCHYTEKVDVFSLGMILWQLFHNQGGNGDDVASLFFDSFTVQEFDQHVTQGGWRPLIDHDTMPYPLVVLITDCWDRDPSQRPFSKDIVSVLAEVEETTRRIDSLIQQVAENDNNIFVSNIGPYNW